MEIPHGYCHCGCGKKTPLALKTNRKRGLVKGQPIAYIHGHNRRKYHFTEEEYKQHRAEYLAAHYLANKDSIAEREARRYLAKRESILARNAKYQATWQKTPKGKGVCKRELRRRKARRRDAFVEDIDRDAVFIRDEGRCGVCQQFVDPDAWDLDHILPLGPGTETYDNVRVTCQQCNRAKGAEDKCLLAEWRRSQAA